MDSRVAYGKGQGKGSEKRMVDLDRAESSHDLAKLRDLVIGACGTMAGSVWPVSVLGGLPSGKDLDAAMLKTQSGFRGTLNSVWAEKARLIAKSAVQEQVRRARGNLYGRLKHLSTIGDVPLQCGTPRLVNFPEVWSTRLAPEDVESMQSLADSMGFDGAMDLFRKLRQGDRPSSLTPLQADALRAMFGLVEDRFTCPTWDADDGVVQLHLDVRCISGGRTALDALLGRLTDAAKLAAGSEPARMARFGFLISSVVARGTPIKLDASVRADVVRRLMEHLPEDADARFTTLTLEIGPREAVVKGVLTQAPRMLPLDQAEHLLGVDFGYTNTAAAALVKVDPPLDAEWLKDVAKWGRERSREYLTSHSHDGEPIQEVLHDGRDFLSRIAGHAAHVDRLRSEIDRLYNRMGRIRHEVNRLLGRPSDERIDLETMPNDKRHSDLLIRFAKLLEAVNRLKLKRRLVYRAVEGLKTSWFGHVTTRLVTICRENRAAYVHEHLTVVASEKDGPGYKGRTFNRMINSGSKGQFLRRVRMKLAWNGVPRIVVPSWFTSTTDVRYGIVDGAQRNGEIFRARIDGRQRHADLHAALTIALWPILRPAAAPAAA
jgi:transposase